MTKVDPDVQRCRAAVTSTRTVDVPHSCGNKTKHPSGRCWRHR